MDLVEILRPAVVAILAKNGAVNGTGFFITSDGYILTCYHVVKEVLGPENIVKIKLSNGEILDSVFVEDKSNTDGAIDFAVLKVGLTGYLPCLPLSTDFRSRDKWCTLGYIFPKDYESVPDSGIIYSIDLRPNQQGHDIRLKADNAIRPGASGSPVICGRSGAVIGTIKSVAGGVEVFAVPIHDVFFKWNELSKLNSKSNLLLNIKDDLSEFFQASDVHSLVPHQIPSPPSDFKGREEEIRDILYSFSCGATILGLWGMGGVGKTTLALVLAGMLKDRYSDGQIFIDMYGTNKSPLTPAKAMSHVIHAYYPDAQLKEDLNEIKGRYLTVLAEKKVLLLLDNAYGNEQIEPLVPPSSCAMIVTSRKKFVLPGMNHRDIVTLLPPDSRDLLLVICERIDSHADELAKLCGYLPVALRNAGSVLAKRKDIGVIEYVRKLRDATMRLKLVDASFTLSYDMLSIKMKRYWCLLSVFPSDFDEIGATAIWNIDLDSAKENLSELVGMSLLVYLDGTNRYKLHNLARDFAASHLDTKNLNEALERHSKHYLKILYDANLLYKDGEEKNLAGLKLLDNELSNIIAGQTWSENIKALKRPQTIEERRRWETALDMSEAYIDLGFPILDLRLHPNEKIRWLKNALNNAKQQKDLHKEAFRLSHLGIAYAALGDANKAIKCSKRALSIYRQNDNSRGIGRELGTQSRAYADLGDTREAIKLGEQALAISRENKNKRGESFNLTSLGRAYSNTGNAHEAIKFYQEALTIARQIKDHRGEAANLGNIGRAYNDLGDVNRAIEYHEQALAIACKIGDRKGEGADLANLGRAYNDLSDANKAIEFLEKALIIARETRNKRGESSGLGVLGKAYINLGDARKAIDLCKRALAIAREIGDRRNEGANLAILGDAYNDLGDAQNAIQYHEQALAIAREIGDRSSEGSVLFGMSLALDKLSDRTSAIDLAQSAYMIFEQIHIHKKMEEVMQSLAKWKR